MAQTICIGFGRANFSDASVGLACFVVEPTWVRTYPANHFTRKWNMQRFPSTNHEESGGVMLLNTLDTVPDGPVLLLQAQHKMHGASRRDGGIFIRLRESGPGYTVTASLPQHRTSLLGDGFLCFQGRGDLMSLDDVHDLGITPTEAWIDGFMAEDEVAECFTIHELSRETAARPKQERVVNLSGQEVTINATNAGRRIKVR